MSVASFMVLCLMISERCRLVVNINSRICSFNMKPEKI